MHREIQGGEEAKELRVLQYRPKHFAEESKSSVSTEVSRLNHEFCDDDNLFVEYSKMQFQLHEKQFQAMASKSAELDSTDNEDTFDVGTQDQNHGVEFFQNQLMNRRSFTERLQQLTSFDEDGADNKAEKEAGSAARPLGRKSLRGRRCASIAPGGSDQAKAQVYL